MDSKRMYKMSAFTCRRKCILTYLLVNAFLFLLFGILFQIFLDIIMDYELKKQLIIKKGTQAYSYWQKPPVPVQFGIYVFDLKNPREVLAGTEVPYFEEKGPYVWRMSLHKENITFHDNGTASYRQPQKYVFDRDASAGPENDTFLSLNEPYITMAGMLQFKNPMLQMAASMVLSRFYDGPFLRTSVSGIWWGYADPVFELAAKELKLLNISFPFPSGKFGFYTGRNNTDDGLYNVFTGSDGNFDHYAMIDRWNGNKSLHAWTNDFANRIEGSDGSQHKPRLTTSDNISMFDPNLMRSLTMLYKGPSNYVGIRCLHYELPYSTFANPKEKPENVGFCTPNRHHCIPSGAYNMSGTKGGAAVYVSMPHFLGADPYYLSLIDGLHPDHKKHVPFYDVHAMTGVSIKGSRRYQISLKTESYQHFTAFKNFPVTYFPVLWIDGASQMGEDQVVLFRDQLQAMMDAMPYVRAGMFALSLLCFIISGVLVWYWKRKQKKTIDLTVNSGNDDERTHLLSTNRDSRKR